MSGYKGRWQLEIGGGDGAESYGVRYTFDKRPVLSRELQWDPDYSETARYDIQFDQDGSPLECISAMGGKADVVEAPSLIGLAVLG